MKLKVSVHNKNRLFRTTNYHFVFGSVWFLWFKIRWLLVCRVLLHCYVALHCLFIKSVLHYLNVKYCICLVNVAIVEERKKKKIKCINKNFLISVKYAITNKNHFRFVLSHPKITFVPYLMSKPNNVQTTVPIFITL